MAELSRRGLLTGSWRRAAAAIRPPWSGDEHHFLVDCTRCDACVTACQTRVLRRGPGGYPQVDFHHGECTFCYACANACPEQLFLPQESSPWRLRLEISDLCLAWQQVECRSCQDACVAQAIKFYPVLQGVSRPQLAEEACNACGACVAGCPVSAISLRPHYAN